MREADSELLIFRRQYFQLLDPDFLSWPQKRLLQDHSAQEWLSRNLFESEPDRHLPSDRYRFRVLKDLIARIERVIENPDEHEVHDSLMSHFSILLSSGIPTELIAAQQKSYVTYSFVQTLDSEQLDKSITILERRNLISGSQTTGYRTWEAALHLASYLWATRDSAAVAGRTVIELGAGTGLLSLLCAKYLDAASVLATDGDQSVVDALAENGLLNQLGHDNNFTASVLRWGEPLHNLSGKALPSFDLILGADIIYDKAAVSPLVSTLAMLFKVNPQATVLMASAVRNQSTYAAFLEACAHQAFDVRELDFAVKPVHQQLGIFYATAMPLKILAITPPSQA